MKSVCIIPARYGSTRLPGKPLLMIGDQPMIQWVYNQALKANCFDQVLVATDDRRVAATVEQFGGKAVLTPSDLPSGTDRVARVARTLDAEVVINLQGDEPFVPPELLQQLKELFSNPDVQIATPITRITHSQELFDPNVVKVIVNQTGQALYFSRSPLPFVRDLPREQWLERHTFYKHIGIYAYRLHTLFELSALKRGTLEESEKLEQLRFLENGFIINTLLTSYQPIGVDTKEDLIKANQILQKKQN